MQQFSRYSIGLFCLLVSVLALVACGSESKTAPNAEAFKVVLELPHGSDPKVFWQGIKTKKYLWQEQDSEEVNTLTEEQAATFPFQESQGGVLRFEGIDDLEEIAVEGQSTITQDTKTAVIVLKRRFN